MTNREKPDDGISADEAVAEGFGSVEPTINAHERVEAIFPNPLGPSVIAPVDDLNYGGQNLPPEVDPSRAGLNNDSAPDDLDKELDRLTR